MCLDRHTPEVHQKLGIGVLQSMSVDVHATLVYGVVLEAPIRDDVWSLGLEKLGLGIDPAGNDGDLSVLLVITASRTSTDRITNLDLATLVTDPKWDPLLRSACEKYGFRYEGRPGWLLFCCRL